jgi:K+-sensing histidine kinase KdpD
MSKSNPPRWRSKSSAISRYAIAVLSVGIAIVVAELLTVFLHTEPIASLMIAAVMFVAWFGGFGPGLLAIALAVLAIHYYVVPPLNSFALKNNLFSLGVAELPRLILFSIAALFVTLLSSAQRVAAESLRRSRDGHLLDYSCTVDQIALQQARVLQRASTDSKPSLPTSSIRRLPGASRADTAPLWANDLFKPRKCHFLALSLSETYALKYW